MIKSCMFLGITIFLVGSLHAQDAEPKLIFAPAFVISAEDEAAGIDGTMKVAVNIDKTGSVTRSTMYVGPAWPCGVDLDSRAKAVIRAAEKAVLGYKFSPALTDGKPVESQVGITLTIGAAARKKNETASPPDPNAIKVPRQISGGVVNGKAEKLGKPSYPPEARAAAAAGTVTIQILIGEDGKILTAQAISGNPLLHFASRDAACSSKFRPTTLQGHPVKVSGTLLYNFVL